MKVEFGKGSFDIVSLVTAPLKCEFCILARITRNFYYVYYVAEDECVYMVTKIKPRLLFQSSYISEATVMKETH